MIIDFLVINLFGAFFDLKALIAWIIFYSVFYYYFDTEEEKEDIKILKELNQKIDYILTKIN